MFSLSIPKGVSLATFGRAVRADAFGKLRAKSVCV